MRRWLISFVLLVAGSQVAAGADLVLVVGATGRTGQQVVRELNAAGYRVRALVRDADRARPVLGDRVDYAVGDVRQRASVDAALPGVRYVISTIGSTRKDPANAPEFVDFEYTANVARVNLVALASLANAPAKPKNVGIVTGRLTNDTDLKWDANSDATIAGYEVVWRDTTAAEWTSGKFVGNVKTYTAKAMSKDNYFFGVRAVDKDGNKSPVVYPRPVR